MELGPDVTMVHCRKNDLRREVKPEEIAKKIVNFGLPVKTAKI